MNVTKQNGLTDMDSKLRVTSGEREGWERQDKGRELRGTNYYV